MMIKLNDDKTWGLKFWSYEIELGNRVTQNDVTLRVTNSNFLGGILLWSH